MDCNLWGNAVCQADVTALSFIANDQQLIAELKEEIERTMAAIRAFKLCYNVSAWGIEHWSTVFKEKLCRMADHLIYDRLLRPRLVVG
jgi:hypothetical protein